MKAYQIKVFDPFGAFKKQINPRNVTSGISFSETLDGGQGDLALSFIGEASEIQCADIIEIRELEIGAERIPNYWNDALLWDDTAFWEDYSESVVPTYTGIVERVSVDEYREKSVLTLNVLWAFTVLNDVIYRQSGNRTFVKNGTPGAIVKSVIDHFNAERAWLAAETENLGATIIRYADEFDETWTAVSVEFDNDDCLSAIAKATKDTGFRFFIGADGKCVLLKEADFIRKNLTFDREINKISKTFKKDDMVNRLYLERAGWTVTTYSDAWSIAAFGIKEKFESRTDLQDATSANLVGNARVSEFGYERDETVVFLKPQRADFLRPWTRVTTMNTRSQLFDKTVTKIDKSEEGWKVYFGDFRSFGKAVTWK